MPARVFVRSAKSGWVLPGKQCPDGYCPDGYSLNGYCPDRYCSLSNVRVGVVGVDFAPTVNAPVGIVPMGTVRYAMSGWVLSVWILHLQLMPGGYCPVGIVHEAAKLNHHRIPKDNNAIFKYEFYCTCNIQDITRSRLFASFFF